MELVISPIIELLAIGAILGYFIGYIIKKLLHLALIIGVFTFLLGYMMHRGAINLDFEEVGATITGYADALEGLGFASLASSSPFVGSLIVGLVLGFTRG